MLLLFLYLMLAIGVSFLCSVLEAVLLSVSDSYIAVLEGEGNKDGRLLRELKQDIDRPLSTILSLNTIAHTVGAAGVGAQALVVFGSGYVAVTSAVLTLLILVFSEIIPKTLGAKYWRRLAPVTARLLKLLIVALYPFVWMSQKITRLIARDQEAHTFTREELAAIAERGAKDGVLEQKEFMIFKNMLLLKSLKAKDVMTPRTVVESLHQDQTIRTIFDETNALRFSRLPIYNQDNEDIVGYILTSDLLTQAAHGKWDKPLIELKRDILVMPEIITVKEVFEILTSKQEHIASLVDEYGGFAGIVTLEDVVETLLGMEIMDEFDTVDDMQQLARHKWLERALRLQLIDQDKIKHMQAALDKVASTEKQPPDI